MTEVDPYLDAQLAYCVPRGIPLSSFGSGRSPVWTEQDAQLAIAWTARQNRKCSQCGSDPLEWAKDRFAYQAHQYACSGCEVVAQEKRNVPEQAADWVQVGLLPRELAEQLEEAESDS